MKKAILLKDVTSKVRKKVVIVARAGETVEVKHDGGSACIVWAGLQKLVVKSSDLKMV